jgi:TRAP-type C4-dicarboxylate transport system permease small subunit
MKTILKKIDRVFEIFEEYIMLITGTAVTMMILINALFRVIQVDWFGAEELTLIVGVWLYFVGSICAGRENIHISGDMLNMFISNKHVTYGFNILRDLVSLVMSGVFTVWTYQFLAWQISLGAQTAVYKVPNFISLIPIPLFFAFWTLYLLRNLVVQIGNKPGKTEEGGESV